MAYKSLTFHLHSVVPLLMHRGGMADPLDTFAKALKRISGKRNKTEADYAELARIEWYGSLYVNEGQQPCLPAELVEATLINAAKKIKRGMQAKAGLLCPMSVPLHYEGPESIDALWADPRFQSRDGVVVDRKRIMRTRPKFPTWEARIEIQYDPLLLNASEVREIVVKAGEEVGFGDWRPRYGRFIVLEAHD